MADILKYDVEGQEIITNALMELLNSFPGLQNDSIRYAVLEEARGKAIFPTSGAAVTQENKDVTGHVEQSCEYPFIMIYRASGLSESKKEKVKEWLDNLGRWLERQPVVIDGTEYKLESYPPLTRGRVFKSISRASTAFLDSINEDNAENWAINISATYSNEYDL